MACFPAKKNNNTMMPNASDISYYREQNASISGFASPLRTLQSTSLLLHSNYYEIKLLEELRRPLLILQPLPIRLHPLLID